MNLEVKVRCQHTLAIRNPLVKERFKVNFDITMDNQNSRVGFGVICRYHGGGLFRVGLGLEMGDGRCACGGSVMSQISSSLGRRGEP
ncbi:hypothetical protein M5689_016715 [Euphorbia peplus]|nr:hypothetical protein M5689_016715 [Euphorbia peplus]